MNKKVLTLEEVRIELLKVKEIKINDLYFKERGSISEFVLKEEVSFIDKIIDIIDSDSEIEVKNTLISHISNVSSSLSIYTIVKGYLAHNRVPAEWTDMDNR